MNPILSEYSHLNVKILRSKLSEMRSAIGAVLTGLEIQRATVFASDFDDLPKHLRVSRSGIGFLLDPPIAPTITSMTPISMMKNEIPMAKKFAVSRTTTKTEKTSRNTPVKLVILEFAALGCFDKDNPHHV
ncbi:hypothetical protein AUF78_05205 [archaeon 13_1_20CM_2_51_12]|nr:MAG: hypothetical protein AUF78_05205 [archaeon 13_1_20CM_2_51_12]